jgi:hypothetical protein
MIRKPFGAALCALVLFAGSQAEAKVYLSATNKTFENSFYLTALALKLNDAGATSLTFSLPAPSRVAITYSAECRVGGAGADAAVVIKVDGAVVAPTGSDTVFCNTELYGMHSITVSRSLAAGKHKIRVEGDSNAAQFGFLRHSSLVVFD